MTNPMQVKELRYSRDNVKAVLAHQRWLRMLSTMYSGPTTKLYLTPKLTVLKSKKNLSDALSNSLPDLNYFKITHRLGNDAMHPP